MIPSHSPKPWLFAVLAAVSLWGLAVVRAENPSYNADQGVYIDVLERTYFESHYDLSIYLPGFEMQLNREYSSKTGWSFTEILPPVTFTSAANDPAVIETITRQGVDYAASGAVWTDGVGVFEVIGSGYRFTDPASLLWEQYSASGQPVSIGLDGNTLAEFTLDGSGRVIRVTRPSDGVILGEITYQSGALIATASNHAGATVSYTYSGSLLTSYTDLRGNETTYEYTSGRLTKKTLPGGIVRAMAYDPAYGALQSVVNGNGWGTFYEYNYDATYQEFYAKMSHSNGRVMEKFYNSDRNLSRIRVNGKVVQEIDYLDDGNRIVITDARGNITEERLTVNKTTKTIYLPNGDERRQVVAFDDDEGNYRLIREVDSGGFETRYDYDAQGRVTRKREAVGTPYERIMEFVYDTRGNILTERLVGDALTPTIETNYEYDAFNRIVRIIYPEGNDERLEYDDFNRVAVRYDGYDQPTQFVYNNATGDQLKVINRLGHEAVYTYDFLGREVSILNPSGELTTFAHTLTEWRQVDPEGGVSVMNFDQDGRLVKFVDPSGQQVERDYDEFGRIIALRDGVGNETTMHYDEDMLPYSPQNQGLISRVEYPTFEHVLEHDSMLRGHAEAFIADSETREVRALGFVNAEGFRPSAVRDPSGVITQVAYDPFGQILAESKTVGGVVQVTTFVYDDRGFIVSMQLPAGTEYSFSYDRNGNMVEQVIEGGATYKMAYDLNNNIVETLFPSGRVNRRTYDLAGQLVAENYFATASDDEPALVRSYAYDPSGRLTNITDGDISITFTRDAAGRILSETVDHGDGVSLSHQQSYEANGQLRSLTYPDGVTYTYSYNSAGLPISLDIPGRGVVSFSDYQWNRSKITTFPGGAQKVTSLNGYQEVMGLSVSDPSGNMLFAEQYQRNLLSDVVKVDRPQGDVEYSYDEARQITGALSTAPAIPSEGFSYDVNQNRILKGGQAATYNLANQMLSFNGETFTYNADGQMVTRTKGGVTTNYDYDVAGRLSSIRSGGALVASYRYDGLGRRVIKNVGGQITRFHYSPLGLAVEADASGSVIRSYGYELIGYQEEQFRGSPGLHPLFLKQGGETYFFVYDQGFFPRMLFRPDGLVVWSADYTAFGETFIDPLSTVECNLRLSNQYADSESGIHYNTRRYYDPALGRYLQIDPLGVAASFNFYLFVGNSPLNNTDVYGLACSGCAKITFSLNADRKLSLLGKELKLKVKGSVSGELCQTCCDDGSCGKKGTISGGAQFELEAAASAFSISVGFCSLSGGIKFFITGGGSASGSASIDCDDQCGEFKGTAYFKVGAGINLKGECFGASIEAFGGGAVSVCLKHSLKICGSGSVDLKINDISWGGEIYLELKIIGGTSGAYQLSRSWKLTLVKFGPGC